MNRITGLGPDGDLSVSTRTGPGLLAGLADGPGLAAHRARHGASPSETGEELRALVGSVGLRGRGGAGFPFATKLAAAVEARGRATVVVNLSEGEPASFKDAVLALVAPHLVLDGAAGTAHALGSRTVHVVLPGEHPLVARAIRKAIEERRGEGCGVRWRLHRATNRFVAGQARAVIELMSGRPNLPVTSWQPEAMDGFRGRPTLLSNAETFAQVALLLARGPSGYGAIGTDDSPGTTLLTLRGDTARPEVLEVSNGTDWAQVLTREELDRPVLLGGYHGTWAAPGALNGLPVCRSSMSAAGLTLGAGVVLPLAREVCPLHRTAEIVDYLAGESAGRCGPCLNGLPALAQTLRDLDGGCGSVDRAHQLVGLVTRRGACAHPDGTARLASSVLATWPDEPAAHAEGRCELSSWPLLGRAAS